MNLHTWALLALALALIGGSFHLGETVKQGEWDATLVAEQRGKDAALKAAAAAIAKIEVKSATYIQPVRTEIRDNPVYRECQHSADGLRNINALIVGSEPAGGGSVPASDPAP